MMIPEKTPGEIIMVLQWAYAPKPRQTKAAAGESPRRQSPRGKKTPAIKHRSGQKLLRQQEEYMVNGPP